MSLGDQAEDRVVAVMKRFGYTGTDARTYIAVCVIIQLQVMNWLRAVGYRGQRFTACEASRAGGLGQCRAGKPARYIPLAPERLIEHLESRFSRDIRDFRDAVTQVSGPDTTTLVDQWV